MSPWQLLRTGRANQAALGYRVQHGATASMHYSTAAAAAAPDCSRSFCLSSEKQAMQQLNGRLASYLQQVQRLEAANQRLELQIQEELNRKCPGELRQLDGYLRRASLLQNQIGDCLSAQAQVKLQLLGAQLTAFDLDVRCEKEREQREKVEAELSDLRVLETELKVHKLPELQSLLDNRMQHLIELQTKHQKDVQVLVAQVSGGVAVEMQTAESSDLLRQLEHLRTTSTTLLDKNFNESWFKTQVSRLSSPEVTFDPSMESDLDQTEVKELRRTAASLTEELTRLQTLISVLEVSGREQAESFVLQLEAMQQKVDGLCRDLDLVLQAAAQQAADYDALLDIKSRLEVEIQDYMRLLDEMNHQRVSSLHLDSKPVITSPCVTTSPTAFRRNVTVDKTARVLGENHTTPEVQTVSKHSVRTVEQTPLLEKVTTFQVMRDPSKHLKNSPVRSVNTANVTHSFYKSVGTLPESTGREFLPVKATADKENNLVEDEVQAKDCDLQSPLIVQAQNSEGLDEEVAVEVSQTEIISTLVPDSHGAIQTKVQTSSRVTKSETNSKIEMTKTSPRVEHDVKPEPHFETSDPGKPTPTEETETVILAQMDLNEDSIHAKNKTPAQITTDELETSKVAETPIEESGSQIHKPATVQVEIFDEVTLMEEKDIIIQGNKEVEVVEAEGVPGLGQSLVLSKKFEIEVEEVEVINDTTEVKVSRTKLGNELVGLAGRKALMSTSLTDSGVALSTSGSEEIQSPREVYVVTNTSPEICLSLAENSMTEMPKTSPNVEPEVKPEPHFETSDPGKPRASEETETVILAQMDLKEESVHAKNKTPAQITTYELETPSEVVQASINESGSYIHPSATVQVEVFDEVTLMEDKDIEVQGDKKEQVVLAEGVPSLGQNLVLSKKFEIEVEVINDTSEVNMDPTELGNELVGLTGKEASRSTSLTDSGVALSTSGPEDIQSPREADVVTNTSPEICLSIAENSMREMPKTSPNVEPEVKPEPHFETSDPGKPRASEETETVILAQMDLKEESVHAKYKTPAQIMTYELETPSEVVQASINESGSYIHTSATVQVEVFDEVTLMEDKDIEVQGDKEEQVVLAEGVPILGQNLALSKKFEIEVEVINDTSDGKNDPTGLGNELVGLTGKETSRSTSLTDSGVFLGSSGPEEVLSPRVADILTSPRPEIYLSPVETDVVMSMIDDQLFFPVDLEDHVGIPDLILNPNDPEMFPNPDDPDTYLSSVEIKTCLSPDVEEDDEDTCLNLTEANVRVRPVEKYILSTKEEDQSLAFGGDQEGDRNTKLLMSDREGLVFRPIKDNKEKEVTSSGTNIGSSTQMSRSQRGLEFVDSGVQSIIAEKEEQLGFGGLYRKGVRDVESGVAGKAKKESMESDETAQRKSDRQVVNKPGNSESFESPNEGATSSSVASKPKAMIASSSGSAQAFTAGGKSVRGSGEWIVYGGSLGRTSTSNTGGEESQSVSMVTEKTQPDKGRFGSRGSGEWMVYAGSRGRNSSLDGKSSEGNEDIPSVDSNLATSAPETGRFGKRGSGEWIVYAGSLGRKTSLDGVNNLSSKGNEKNPLVDSNLAMSPPETGRFSSRGSGEWRVYGGQMSSWACSDDLPSAGREGSPLVTMQRAFSPPGAGRFGSEGSGEWKVYGGRMSPSVAMQRAFSPPGAGREGSPSVAMQRAFSPPGVGREGSPSVAMQRAFSPPGVGREGSPSVAMQRAFSPPGAGRFGSEGSGEWRVYGGSTGRVSTARGNNGVISPPSSYTRSGSRRSSTGSASCVIKRSSSVGSGGRLSSSGSGGKLSTSHASQRISGSGRYTSTGSGEWKPVYSSISGRKSSAGSTGWPTTSQRAPSPGGRMGSSGGSGGWLNSSTAGGNQISGTGSGSKFSSPSPGSNERISSIGGGRISSSSGSGRTNSTGGRVISSSDRPIRSTGSGAGGHKERISVCKMAALSISAAGREKNKDKAKQAQKSQQQPQQAAASSPLLQRWLTSADP